MAAGDALFKATSGFLGLATVATGLYLTASMFAAYSSATKGPVSRGHRWGAMMCTRISTILTWITYGAGHPFGPIACSNRKVVGHSADAFYLASAGHEHR